MPHQNIQDLPFIMDISKWDSDVCNPATDAAYKRLASLTIDEALAYRQADFFPTEDDKRQYILSMKADPMFRRALYALTAEHPRTITSNNRFVTIALGAMICNDQYYHQIHELTTSYGLAINSDDDYLFDCADTHTSIKQQSLLKRYNIGFTLREKDRIETMADELGLSVSSLLIVFFWLGISTSTSLDDVFTNYGKTIILQFKRHIDYRMHSLGFSG